MNEHRNTTRDRILDAAEHLFARRGYERATIRHIASSARANLAAVGYYFQGKENLYVAVIERGIRRRTAALKREFERISTASDATPSAESILHALVGTHLRGMTTGPGGYDFMLLLASELQNPRPAVREIFRTHVHPMQALFQAALSDACPALDDDRAALVLVSVMGQALHFIRLRRQLDMAEGDGREKCIHAGLTAPWVQMPLDDYIDYVTRHIARLTVRGLQGFVEGGTSP
jgi:AcrR family transcriptional regulator